MRVRAWIGRRGQFGASALLLKKLAAEDVKQYRTPHQFDTLLAMVATKIQKQDTQMKDAIPPRLKLRSSLEFFDYWKQLWLN